MPIDLSPFEPVLPAGVRALIEEARSERGLAAAWWQAQGWWITDRCEALFRAEERPDDEALGWLAGLTMFFERFRRVAEYVERRPGTAPHAIAAFVAGLGVGMPTIPHQWEAIEAIGRLLPSPPASLVDALPHGLASEQAVERAAALRIARRSAAEARAAIARHPATDKKRARHLAEALAALTPEETPRDERLDLLLTAWADTFDPALIPLVAERGAEVARQRGALAGRSKTEVENAWHAVAERRDPGDVDRLLGAPWPGAWKLALRRVSALGSFPPDPRIAEALPRLSKPYDSFGAAPFRREAGWVVARMRQPKKGDAPSALLAAAARPGVDLDAAWRAFHEAPSDDARRLVLADALQAAGDPRGEFISLSYAEPTPAVRRRLAELLDAHVDAWTGALPGLVRSTRRFERGFLSAVALKPKAASLMRAAEDPAWETIEELHLDVFLHRDEHFAALQRLLGHARQLRTYVHHGLGADHVLSRLSTPAPHVTAVAASWGTPSGPLAAFPALRLFGMGDAPIEAALEATQRVGASTLLLFGVGDLAGAIRAFDASPLLEARFVIGGRFEVEHRGFCVQVFRGTPRARLSWGTGRYAEGLLRALLTALATHGRTELTVSMPRTSAAEQELSTAAGLAITVERTPLAIFRA